MGDDPLVSVVTPVLNGAAHLHESVESVLAQTYPHWELVIVDNHSTDSTLDIARGFAARDPRISVVSNDTCVGIIENHNIAFRQVSPKSTYCKMAYADDLLLPECLEKMVRFAEQHPRVAIVGAYALFDTWVHWYSVPFPQAVATGRDACRARLMGDFRFGTPQHVLYRSDIVRSRHAFFNEANLHADTEACLEFLEHHDYGFVHQILTVSRQRESTRSYADRVNVYVADALYNLQRFGPTYLSDAELKALWRTAVRRYYRFLGEQLFKRWDRELWSYHRRRLRELGSPLSGTRLAAAAMSVAADRLLNPKQTLEGIGRRIRDAVARSGAESA